MARVRKGDRTKRKAASRPRKPDLAQNPEVLRFVELSEAYCELVEHPEAHSRLGFLQKLAETLPLLYTAGMRLPEGEFSWAISKRQQAISSAQIVRPGEALPGKDPQSDAYADTVIPVEQFFDVMRKLEPSFAEYDFYRTVFNQYIDRDANTCTVANDLAEIWRDVKNDLHLFHKRSARARAHAVWSWKFMLLKHWGGSHCANAIKAIHEMLSQLADLEEDGPMPDRAWSKPIRKLIDLAIQEDLGSEGDVTSALLGEADQRVTARVVARQEGIVCGLDLLPYLARAFSKKLDRTIELDPLTEAGCSMRDGAFVEARQPVATLHGPAHAILAAERTLLNFLGRMSGVATLTRRYVDAAKAANPDVKILDTRKTIPGWRELDKYAVRKGGGTNHRTGLYDAVLIKDNHLAGVPTERLASFLFDTLNRLETKPDFVEVEVDNLEQLAEVCKVVGVDIVLLDNFSPDEMREAVALRDSLGLRGKLALEASGKVTLETVADIAATGVDRISVGALTHSAPCLDIGLDF